MQEENEYEEGLVNFHDGDKRLWTKTDAIHGQCGGVIWALTIHFENQPTPFDWLMACERCQLSGTGDALLPLEDNGIIFESPGKAAS